MDSTILIQLFTGYGLTKNQAKIFSTLIQNKKYLTIKQIAQHSNLARESIYNVVLDLKEKGLVLKIITKPKKYCAVPLKSALGLLHDQKNNQIHELEKLTTQALMEYDQNRRINHIEEKSQFVLIPKKKQLVNRLSKAIFNSKKNIKVMTSWKRYLKGANVYNIALKKALSNGVKLQVLVTEKPQKAQLSTEAKFFHNHPNTTIQYVNTQAKIVEAIIDDVEVFLITDPKAELSESSALWSNNKSLIAAIKNCFDAVSQIS